MSLWSRKMNYFRNKVSVVYLLSSMVYNIGKYLIYLQILLVSCTHTLSIKNEKKGELTAKYKLVISSEKKILLDDNSAPKPPYIQIIKEESDEQILTFLNPYMNGIYFYDFENGILVRKIVYKKEGPDAIRLGGYFIKNMDSIYVYTGPLPELALTDSSGQVKCRYSLIGNRDRKDREWLKYYPQYLFTTANPLIETPEKLILTGVSPFSISDSLTRKFKFTVSFDMYSGNVEFMHSYPVELYGFDVNWNDPVFMQPYPVLSPAGELIYSFPISHNVYVSQRNEECYKTIYAGSNLASTIKSIDNSRNSTSKEIILNHFLKHDLYAGILHDPYRNVYYRFMFQGISDLTIKTSVGEKPVVVIIMDENFNYMGETVIGQWEKWNFHNSFVTSEGLMIEFFDPELDSIEEYLIFKILTIEKL